MKMLKQPQCMLIGAAMALGWATTAVAGNFPATGQTTCWDSSGTVISCPGTGQDGDIQAGAPLSYTDTGNGTIIDNNTGLEWEKKSRDGSIHDRLKFYTWENAFAVHVAGLNTPPCFAGHCDWRLPNVKELYNIVDYSAFPLAVSTEFNNNCVAGATVLTGSCTVGYGYWSSTTFAFKPVNAWVVNFNGGGVSFTGKSGTFPVRAVRGGL